MTMSSQRRSRARAPRSSSSPRTSGSRESSYPADGYTRSEVFYPLSSRVFRRSKLRIPVKVDRAPFGMARLLAKPRDVLHVQWFAAPPMDDLLFRARGPKVFTAHDLLPRRSVRKTKMWRRLFSRFDRIVVHASAASRRSPSSASRRRSCA